MTTLHQDGMTDAQEAEAHEILGVLCLAYPDHPWSVSVRGGVIFIRHLEFGSNWGMNVKFNNVNHDAAVLKREIIMMAGEWLERAGLARGRAKGDEIWHVDGVPEKYQPGYRAPFEFKKVIAEPEIRDEPRPQVNSLKDLH